MPSYDKSIFKAAQAINNRNRKWAAERERQQGYANLISSIGGAATNVIGAYGVAQRQNATEQGNAQLLGQLGMQGVDPRLAGQMNSSQLVSALLAKRRQDEQQAATSQFLKSQWYSDIPTNVDPSILSTILEAKIRQQREARVTPYDQARIATEQAQAESYRASADLARWRMQNPAAGGEMSVGAMRQQAEQKRLADPNYQRGRLLEYLKLTGEKTIPPARIAQLQQMGDEDFRTMMNQYSIGNRTQSQIDARGDVAAQSRELKRQELAFNAVKESYRLGGDLQKAKAEAAARYMASRASLGESIDTETAMADVSKWFTDPGEIQVPGAPQTTAPGAAQPAPQGGQTITMEQAMSKLQSSGSKMTIEQYVEFLKGRGIQVQ